MNNEVIGIAGTGQHKEKHLRLFFSHHGLGTQFLRIYRDIPEVESVNPAQVLGPKLVNNTTELADSIRFWAEFGLAPHAIAVFDVLGLMMPPIDPGKAAFGVSREILKKPDNGDAVASINRHFMAHLEQGSKAGWHWDAYSAGGAIAPITKQGIVRLEKGVSMWDDPFWLGYSKPLVEAFASRDTLAMLIAEKFLSGRVVAPSSIVGLRAQYIPYDIKALAKIVPGAEMRIIYRRHDVTIDADTPLAPIQTFLTTVEAGMANATPNLAMQMAKEVHAWHM